MQKDLWRYCSTAILFFVMFHFGPIVHGQWLSHYSDEQLIPLNKAYAFFGGMSAVMMVVMEWVASRKMERVIMVNIVGMMMKFGMFVVFYVGLEGYPETILHGMMIPMVYFLILQTVFIVVKLNAKTEEHELQLSHEKSI